MTDAPPPAFDAALDEWDGPVKQSVVDARALPPVTTSAPNSVFALGAAVDPAQPNNEPEIADMPTEKKSADERKDQIVKTLEACGALSTTKIAEAVAIDRSLVAFYCKALVAEKRLVRIGTGRATTYGVKEGGFKGWLKKKGEASAEGRAPKAPHGGARKGAGGKLAYGEATKTMRVPESHVSEVTAQLKQAATPPTIECGLFNTGEISISAEGEAIRLSAENTRALIAWLSKVDQVLRAEVAV